MASPQTVVRGNDQSTATYALAPGVFQYIESVLIEVDTSGSGDVTPTLSVQTQDGVTLAEKEQGRSIPAGGTGRATWALRLTDESTASSSVTGQLGVYADFGRASTPINNDVRFDFADQGYDPLLDLTFPGFARFAAAGIYIVTAWVFPNAGVADTNHYAEVKMFATGPGSLEGTTWQTLALDTTNTYGAGSLTLPRLAAAGDFLVITVGQNAQASLAFTCVLNIVKIG